MDLFEYKERYSRRLPHIHPPNSTLFVTFRLDGSIPRAEVDRYTRLRDKHRFRLSRIEKLEVDQLTLEKERRALKEFEREWFIRFDEILDKVKYGPRWLAQKEIREIVKDEMHAHDGTDYKLLAYCVMSNHVHLVLKPFVFESDIHESEICGNRKLVSSRRPMSEIMKSIKGVSARKANLALGRSGSFWQRESYDRFVRDREELISVIRYTISNPVKAGLIKEWRNWSGTYLEESFTELFE